MNDQGYIKTYRSLYSWRWFFDNEVLRCWLYLLFKANHQDEVQNGIEVKRGQLITTLSELSRDLRLSVQQVRRTLNALKSTYDIASCSTNKFTLISVCEYDYYQSGGKSKQQTNRQANQQAHQQAIQQAIYNINKEDKEYKENNISANADNINPPIAPPDKDPPGLKKKEPKKYSFVVAPEFEQAFSVWLEYKHQRHETYKSDMSLKVCYNKLVKLAGGDPATAMAIVEQSMGNNWAGLFPLRNERNGTTINQSTGDPRQRERENLARDYAATIARRLAEDDARAGTVRKP